MTEADFLGKVKCQKIICRQRFYIEIGVIQLDSATIQVHKSNSAVLKFKFADIFIHKLKLYIRIFVKIIVKIGWKKRSRCFVRLKGERAIYFFERYLRCRITPHKSCRHGLV